MKKIYSKIETLNYINEELQKRNISNYDLSLILNISVSAISRKLNGNRDFTIQELITISDLFEMDLMKMIQFKRMVK
jgi:plasmid maintenance system antidote protein VapI